MSEGPPSVTAALVASTLLLLRDDDDLGHLVDRGSLESLEVAVRATLPILGHALDHVPWRVLKRVAHAVERAVSPGFVAHYALRKHAVRGYLSNALDDGFRQVVLVGPGFDMMSASLPQGLRIFEVDHPATQRAKRVGVGSSSDQDVTFVPVDLSRSRLDESLRGAGGFDPREDTVFVAEGVLMYLERERVELILEDVAARGRRTRIILTIITPDRRGRPRLHSQRRIVDHCMTLLDEKFAWGEARECVQALLSKHRFDVDTIVSTDELRDRALLADARRRLPRPTGEVIVVATSTQTVPDSEVQ